MPRTLSRNNAPSRSGTGCCSSPPDWHWRLRTARFSGYDNSHRTRRLRRGIKMSLDLLHELPTSSVPPASALAELLISQLSARGQTVVTAESCSAGSLAHLLSSVQGAANSLTGGFVTYRKSAKERLLGINPELLAEFGAVSEAIARAMAVNAIERSGADLAIALTGVTGIEPDEDGNPIGRVHVAAVMADGTVKHRHCEFGKSSPDVLLHAALQSALLTALDLIAEPKH